MALTLLALCHPTHVSALDFLMHISATATIVLGTMALGYKWVSLPRPNARHPSGCMTFVRRAVLSPVPAFMDINSNTHLWVK
jgi:hypothetical protein